MSKNYNSTTEEGIAIIGIGCIYPKASNRDTFWNNIINKVNGITEVPKEKWDSEIYFDPDKDAPDKTYTKIGGFVETIDAVAISKKYKIPPKTVTAMDEAQQYAIIAAGEALEDSGYDKKNFDRERTAVIVGNSMGGDKNDYSNFRVMYGGVEDSLNKSESFSSLDKETQDNIKKELEKKVKSGIREINEDTMPGELSNVIAGRIANTLNLNGPNFSTDAACASSMAALSEAVKGLRVNEFDMAVVGGSDFMMGPGPYVKFSKIGALSADGSMPFDERANGFVMGEGVGMYILKRVSDARKDGDRIYSIIKGIGASSDGKGKGITAPNPKGQILAIERALESAGVTSETIQLVEAHGTSTTVGDAVEVESLCNVWDKNKLPSGSIGLTSVKSMIGHLKAAAGSAAIIKTSLSLYNKKMGPSLNFEVPNSKMEFGKIPFRVITDPEEWPQGINGNPRRAGVSAFGFGGTNFHVILEEDTGTNGMPMVQPYNSQYGSTGQSTGAISAKRSSEEIARYSLSESNKEKLEGETVVIGGSSWDEVNIKIDELKGFINSSRGNGNGGESRRLTEISAKYNNSSKRNPCRLAIAAGSADDLLEKLDTAKKSLSDSKRWLILRNKGIFFGEGEGFNDGSPGKVAFLFPGQGSQYINMMKDLYNKYNIVKKTFDEADEIMSEFIDGKISEKMFLDDAADKSGIDRASETLRQTEYTQPSIITCDIAMYRLIKSFGIDADAVMGHSLGEYGALIVSGVMSFKEALAAVSARGKEMANVTVEDNGKMASISTDYKTVEETLKKVDGYVIPANKNCYAQTVIAGNTDAVLKAMDIFTKEGITVMEIPVSHAFHSEIVAPACVPYRRVLENLDIKSPKIDILANINGEYYPKGEGAREKIIDMLVKHIASPVEFVKQIEKMYEDGVRIFMEIGPKKALTSFVMNIAEKRPHLAIHTNHPKKGGVNTFNEALAALAAYGYNINWKGVGQENPEWRYNRAFLHGEEVETTNTHAEAITPAEKISPAPPSSLSASALNNNSTEGLLGDFREKQELLMKDMFDLYTKRSAELMGQQLEEAMFHKREMEKYGINLEKVMISGISVGLPGINYDVFGDNTFDRILEGKNMIDPMSEDEKQRLVDLNITRLVKAPDGEARFETIKDNNDVVKLAGRMGRFDFENDYGFDKKIAEGLDITTKLAISATIEALRDAGIPLVQLYKKTTTGKMLPTQWGLPEEMQSETGVIFASAFPGGVSTVEDVTEYLTHKYAKKSKSELIELYRSLINRISDENGRKELSDWFAENYSMLEDADKEETYKFNNKFIFRVLSMGHSQIAQFIKAIGPNLQVNTACSSTVSAIGTAEDWIRTGRAKRVVVVGTEALTESAFLEWITGGFLALGAATTEGDYRKAAVPFDKRRNGTIIGMGAAGLIIEAESEVEKRGMKPIAELVATELANSGFHVGRLDQEHIKTVMDKLMNSVEKRTGLSRKDIIDKMVFMSHETFTPRRGGSASAEVESLRTTFGNRYKDILISNTKGFTGHPIGAGVEDVTIIKALQTGKVPPIANYKEMDEELGELNLSHGGEHDDIQYGLRLAAGFGSQITMSFVRLVSRDENRVARESVYNNWMREISGSESPELEIVNRALRIKDDGGRVKKLSADKSTEKTIQTPAAPKIEAPAPQAAAPAAPGPVQPIPSAPAPQTAAAPNANDAIRSRICALVAEKTGYPEEMIEFDLDMESDLGIDTVKQAELFGNIREVFDIPKLDGLQIKDYPTLDHVIEFVKKNAPGYEASQAVARPIQAETTPQAVPPVTTGTDDAIRNKVCSLVADKTGYPEDMIEFDLDMESDLGIDTVKQAELFGNIREVFDIPKLDGLQIKDYPTLDHVIEFVKKNAPGYEAAEAAPSPQPLQAQAAPPVTTGADDAIRNKVCSLVADKTGYPEDMIEFDLDMESDLGIDTVKQAELFGSIREIFEIPKLEGLQIKDYPTLDHVIEFVKKNAPGYEAAPAPQPVQQEAIVENAEPAITGADDAIRNKVCSLVADKTGYPEDMIEFDLDMESDLGIDTVKQAELFGSIREIFEIPKLEGLQIKDYPTLDHVIEFVKKNAPGYEAAPAPQPVQQETIVEDAEPAIAGADDAIRNKVCSLVADKTGYPEDMIEFDLDMESDLGIDTVKQAELFGSIREIFEIPKLEGLQIKDYPTLDHVVEFVKSNSTITAPARAAAEEIVQSDAGTAIDNNIKRMVVEMVEEPIEKGTEPGFDLKGRNILITDDGRGISEELSTILKEQKAKVKIVDLTKIKTEEALLDKIAKLNSRGKISGLIHLAPLEKSKNINNISYDEWKEATFRRVKALFLMGKSLQEELVENGKSGSGFVVSATPMGGSLGFEDYTAKDPIAGGVTGLTKSLNKELEGVLVKAIDFSGKAKPSAIAKSIFNEIQHGGDKVEVGYSGKKRMMPQVIYKELDKKSEPKISLEEGSVFVMTGGGFGITGEIAKDIASHFKPKIAILSIEEIPSNIEELASMDEKSLKELKEKLTKELKAEHERVTPVMIEKAYGKYTRAIEIHNNMKDMEKEGAQVVEYYNCDVTNHDQMSDTIKTIIEKHGKIDGIVHGAGLEMSKLLEDKKYSDFCLVFDVKANGCYNLVELTKDQDVKVLVTFASISGRFGNIGQTDYSAANDLLNKYAQFCGKRFDGRMKAVSMNWTGWKGVGMATRGSFTKIFDEMGVDMIPLEDGVPRVREEILYGNNEEVVIAGNVADIDSDGLIVGNKTKEFKKLLSEHESRRDKYSMIDEILAFESDSLIVAKKRLDTEQDLYLKDHAIESVPYLPAVMGIESFAQASHLLFPELEISAMRNIRFQLPIKILKGKPIDILITLKKEESGNEGTRLLASIETEFFNKDGVKLGDNRLHFTAEIYLNNEKVKEVESLGNGKIAEIIRQYKKDGSFKITDDEIYKRFFHGPKFQVHAGILNVDGNEVLGKMADKDDEIFSFIKKPRFISDPLVVEAAFQNAGLLGMIKNNVSSLPDTIEELVFKEIPKDVDNLYIWARHSGDDENKQVYSTEIIDSKGNVYSAMKGYKMITTGELKGNDKF